MASLEALLWRERHLMNERELLENRLRQVAEEITDLLERANEAPVLRLVHPGVDGHRCPQEALSAPTNRSVATGDARAEVRP